MIEAFARLDCARLVQPAEWPALAEVATAPTAGARARDAKAA